MTSGDEGAGSATDTSDAGDIVVVWRAHPQRSDGSVGGKPFSVSPTPCLAPRRSPAGRRQR
jgi:hypothetical protein